VSTGPIFVATFADKVCTRMSINCMPDDLDLERGKTLARYAYESRVGKPAPAFTKAHFENTDGNVLMSYSAIELNDDADSSALEPDEPAPSSQPLTPNLPPLEPAYRRVRREKRRSKKDD
jgi:hypothetical protein